VLQVEFGVFAVVGALQVAMRPTTLIGWVITTVALVVAIFKAGDTYTAYDYPQSLPYSPYRVLLLRLPPMKSATKG
jgi:hypothetical protein